MADKKRILIIDDDLSTKVKNEHLFKNCGFEAEVFVATSLGAATQKLKEWADQGHAADIVDSDYWFNVAANPPPGFKPMPARTRMGYTPCGGYNGIAGMHYLLEWIERTLPQELQPKKYFMHSDNPDVLEENLNNHLKSKIEIFHAHEYFDIGHLGMGDEHATHDSRCPINFRQYLNTKFGARYPLTGDDLRKIKPLPERIGVERAHRENSEHGLPTKEAIARLDPEDVFNEFRSHIDDEALQAKGTSLSIANRPQFKNAIGKPLTGYLAFDEKEADALHKEGKKAILVLENYDPQHTHLLSHADGIILLGSGSEHLELVLANHGISALLGVSKKTPLTLSTVDGKKQLEFNDGTVLYPSGRQITIAQRGLYFEDDDGKPLKIGMPLGVLFKGELPIREIDWLDTYNLVYAAHRFAVDKSDYLRTKNRGYAIRANADTPEQVAKAVDLAAQGIGLLRTEHMFFAKERLAALQSVLLAENDEVRMQQLTTLKQFQKEDFVKTFAEAKQIVEFHNRTCSEDKPGDRDRRITAALQNFPVTIRLLDAPPEEFFAPEQIAVLTKKYGAENLRGVQLAQRVPGLYAMQAEAIFEAAKHSDFQGKFDIMIPLIRTPAELHAVKREIAEVAQKHGMRGRYGLCAMIETVDAVKHAGEIAREVDGISFGTNDLTAEVMGGIKRNDVAAAHQWSIDKNHVGKSPFLTLAEPVKDLMRQTVDAARAANPAINIGICGHQVAADPASLEFCQEIGLDSVSVPATVECMMPTRIFAAQAALKHPREKADGFAARNPRRDPLSRDGSSQQP